MQQKPISVSASCLSQIKSYVTDPSRRGALLVHGPTGSGKSCLLGKVATAAGSRKCLLICLSQGRFAFPGQSRTQSSHFIDSVHK